MLSVSRLLSGDKDSAVSLLVKKQSLGANYVSHYTSAEINVEPVQNYDW